MTISRGKDFERIIKQSFMKVPNTSVYRLQDSMGGYSGVANICDFIVYHYPKQYFIECKTIHGNTFPLSNISKNQIDGMIDMGNKFGISAGVIIWWVDRDVTMWIPIAMIEVLRFSGKNSIRYDDSIWGSKHIYGKKKRVFFEYNMEEFFNEV